MSHTEVKKSRCSFFNVSWHHLFIKVMHNLQLDHFTVYVELHDIIRISGSQI